MIFGIRFDLNPLSAPFCDDRPTMFLSNHLSRVDFAGLHLFPDAAVMMNAMFFRMPVLGPVIRVFAQSTGIIGTEQSQENKASDQDQLGLAMQNRRNIFVFPEGIQTDGRRLLRYSKGAGEIFYNAELVSKYPALKSALVQPAVFRVKTIEGEDVIDEPGKWDRYSIAGGRVNIFAGMSRLSMVGSMTVDVLVLPPLDPGNFDNAADLINGAHEVARKIMAPGQKHALTRRQWKERLDAQDFTT